MTKNNENELHLASPNEGSNDTQGVKNLERDVRETAKTSEAILQLTEQDLGRSVVNPQNFLKQPERKRLKPQERYPSVEQSPLFEDQTLEQ